MVDYDKETEFKLAEVRLGLELQDFKRGPIGRYLLGRVRGMADEAMDRLKVADPTDWKQVQAHQNVVMVADLFERFIDEAITNGNNAEAQLKHNDDTSGDES